ncbi:protein kinase domain-containing protein [Roseiflexus sp.]|uniref:protein kinase domain-containing protein n=1 Tax=Roseiflexus sp. TaxID=2562120 RepID=UPI00398A84D8
MNDLLGQMIGNCRIEALLGAGGMGQVFRARHVHLDRLQAIKIMHPHMASDPGFQARFRREAQAIAALEHPHIVRIFDFDEQQGRYYIAMEYLPDGSLRTLLDRRAREGTKWPLVFGLDLIRQAAEALDFAHARGIVHRDIKPDNMLIERHAGPGGRSLYVVKLTDFGLARMVEGGGGITASGMTVGTPAYMSPEQCQGLPVDGRSDIYSLGIVLYEVVTGYLPFTVSRISEAVEKHVYAQPPSPRTVAPDLPVTVEAIILRCLAKKPEERFATGAELAQALRQVMQAPPPPPPPAPGGLFVRVLDAAGQTVQRVPLTGEGLTIGRRVGHQIVLDDPAVSRNHVNIEWSGRRVRVKDLGSRGGTLLDGAPLTPHESHTWEIGQRLKIGPFTLELTQHQKDWLGVTLAPGQENLTIVAGQEVAVEVTLVNRGTVADTLTLAVEGWPAQWVRLPDAPVRIGAGSQAVARLVLHVPAMAGLQGGTYQVHVHARSTTQPDMSIAVPATWSVMAPPSLSMRITPETARGRDQARYLVQLTNQGGTTAHVVLMAEDNNQALAYNFAHHELHLPPGETVEISLEVRSSRRVFGGAQTHRFTVTAAVLGAGPATVEATFVQTALLPI